ncbi:hypothetical protein M5K25_018509 [Dendrobium thyrsiflorum]|uniref:Uncharacterized protein n=1 Tax=Dendrobium thyrsiflorum TaxID=117978 RepID=A0ABD0UQB9_DENTH
MVNGINGVNPQATFALGTGNRIPRDKVHFISNRIAMQEEFGTHSRDSITTAFRRENETQSLAHETEFASGKMELSFSCSLRVGRQESGRENETARKQRWEDAGSKLGLDELFSLLHTLASSASPVAFVALRRRSSALLLWVCRHPSLLGSRQQRLRASAPDLYIEREAAVSSHQRRNGTEEEDLYIL